MRNILSYMLEKTSVKFLFTLLSILIMLDSCKKNDDEFYGPSMGVAPDDFSMSALTVSNANQDFTIGTVYFNAQFNATVRWTLELKGQTSGALKYFTGVSSAVDQSNSTWDGSTDTIKMFRTGETVEAKLAIFGWNETPTTTLTIFKERSRGKLIASFESAVVSQSGSGASFSEGGFSWGLSFDQSGAEKISADKVLDPEAPHGSYVLNLTGNDLNSSYYVGAGNFNVSSGQLFGVGVTPDPNNVYINLYLKGAGSASSRGEKIVLQAREEDDGGGGWTANEDQYEYEIGLKYDGWRLHTIKYASMTRVNTGNSQPNPEKIHYFGFYYGCSGGIMSVVMDHLCITSNGPLVP